MAIKFIGFAAVIFALWRLHKRGQSRFEELKYHVENALGKRGTTLATGQMNYFVN